VTKTGSGKWILSGGNNYSGVTTVQGGTLELAAIGQGPVLTGAGGADLQGGRLLLDYSGVSPLSGISSAHSYPSPRHWQCLRSLRCSVRGVVEARAEVT
jgi:autotransporter-associated beta strand protein